MSSKPVLRIKRLAHGAGLPLPEYQTSGSAGCDLSAAVPADQPVILNPGERARIPTGLALAIPAGYEGQVRPRSGLASRNGITVLNTPGTIDSDYRGELQIILANFGQEPFAIERGARVAQFVVAPVSQCRIEDVEDLDETERGADGFGSTGT